MQQNKDHKVSVSDAEMKRDASARYPQRAENPRNNERAVGKDKLSHGRTNAQDMEKNKPSAKALRLRLLIAFGVIAILVIACAAVNISIGVKEIEVEGAVLCTREELLEVAGIEEGSGYFSYNTSASEKKIKEVYPCVTDISISRSVFGKVTVSVTEEKALWYIQSYNEYFALSADLRVIKIEDGRSRFIELGLVRLDFPEVKSALLGRTLEIADGDRDTSYVLKLLSDVVGTRLYKSGRVDQIRVKTKFEIFFVVDCLHLVSAGNCTDIPEKLKQVENMLADSRLDWGRHTEITVFDISSPSVREDPTLDFSFLQ